jgi:hypothetical protein
MLLACVGLSASVRQSLPLSLAVVSQLVTWLLSPGQLLQQGRVGFCAQLPISQ